MEEGEVTCIAMHLISAHEGTRKDGTETRTEKTSRIFNSVIKIIEEYFGFKIERNSFDFCRFRYHIQYFIRRKESSEKTRDVNLELYENMKDTYPKIYDCAKRVECFMEQEFQESCSKDEVLYLMVHINRLYSKEVVNSL